MICTNMKEKDMKKYFVLLISLIACLLFLTACNGENDEDDFDDYPSDFVFFNTDNLNYNDDYFNSLAPEEKGFILFDSINFNRLTVISHDYTRKPQMQVIYNNEIIEYIQMSPHGTVYPSYTFHKTGEYTIKVIAFPRNLSNWVGTFTINVQAGGYPDQIVMQLKDLDDNIVEAAQAGEEYKLVAKVFSDDILLNEDTEKFTSFWVNGEEGSRERTISIPNHINDTQTFYTFRYICVVGTSSITLNTNYTVDILNNYEELRVDYSFLSNATSLDVVETYNFMSVLSAEHIFTNGEKQAITVNYTTPLVSEGTIIPFIRYNGVGDFTRYIRGMHNISSHNYISNGTAYQLDPSKDSVELYLALSIREDFIGGYRYIYEEIEGSRLSFALIKNAPDAITIPSIDGQEKDYDSNSSFPFFTDREVIEDEVEVKVRVTNNVNTANQAKQFFTLNVELIGEYSLADYYILISDFTMISYNSTLQRFTPLKAGETEITIKSAFSDVEYTLKVKISNPIKSYLISLEDITFLNKVPTFFFGEVDFAPYIMVEERLYNNTSRYRRMNETESLRYRDSDGFVENFNFKNRRYENIGIRLYENEEEKTPTSIVKSFFVLPDIAIEVNGIKYSMSDAQENYYVNTNVPIWGSATDTVPFIGYIPYLTINLNAGDTVEVIISPEEEKFNDLDLRFTSSSTINEVRYYNFEIREGIIFRELSYVEIFRIKIEFNE